MSEDQTKHVGEGDEKWNNINKTVLWSIWILKETCKIQGGFESIDLPGTAALLITSNKPLLYPNPHI